MFWLPDATGLWFGFAVRAVDAGAERAGKPEAASRGLMMPGPAGARPRTAVQ